MKKPELLSPAGSLKNMRYAFAYGAGTGTIDNFALLVRYLPPEV